MNRAVPLVFTDDVQGPVTGGLELSRATGAQYVIAAGCEVAFEQRAVTEGDVIEAGPIHLQIMATPGHTRHHVSFCAATPVGDVETLADGVPLRSYAVSDFAGLAAVRDIRALVVLGVRQAGEYDGGHLPGALNVPLHELAGRLHDVPTGEVWVHCGSGYRAAIAASMLDVPGRMVVLVDDAFAL